MSFFSKSNYKKVFMVPNVKLPMIWQTIPEISVRLSHQKFSISKAFARVSKHLKIDVPESILINEIKYY